MLFILLILLAILIIILLHVYKLKTSSTPWMPLNLPLVGNLVFLFHQRNTILDWAAEFGEKNPHMYVGLPQLTNQPAFATYDPRNLQHILYDNFENYDIPLFRINLAVEAFGNGIFSVNGDRWEIQRELAKPLFKALNRKHMVEVYVNHSKHLMQKLEHAFVNKEVLDIQTVFKELTIDTFGEIGFGVQIGSLLNPVQFCKDFDWLQDELEERIFWARTRFWMEKKLKTVISRMNNYVYDIIASRRTDKNLADKTDVLSILLHTKNIEGNIISDKFIRDFLVNFFIAGRDTTATLLTWTMYYFSVYPEIRDKVAKEVKQILGTRISPTFEECKTLKFMRMVFDEVLRLHPPALPVNAKEARKDDTLPSGHKIRAGQVVMISPYVTHRQEKYWGSRSREFWPERWEDPNLIKHPFQFIPFLKGPRVCMGMQMAYEEATTVVCIILQNNFCFSLVPGQKFMHKRGFPIISSIKDGVKVRVEKQNSIEHSQEN